jgi:hypothetical protein
MNFSTSEIPLLLIRHMNLEEMKGYRSKILRSRKKIVWFGLNGAFTSLPRREVIDAVSREIAVRETA